MARALAELDFAPGELEEDQYEVRILVQPEEGFLGVGGSDARVEVTLADDLLGPAPDPVDDYDDASDDEFDEDSLPRRERSTADPHIEWEVDDEGQGGQDEDAPDAGSARLRSFLGVILEALGVDARVRIVEEVDVVSADVAGEDVGVFIGRRGQTIDAVEYLASLVLYPRPDSRKRVEIDAEGYKERRRQSLERTALAKAREAVRRGRPIELEPMTPSERKIVHLALRDRRDVSTESRGREPNRGVVITPTRSR